MCHYTPNISDGERFTALEAYLDLYFQGLDDVLKAALLSRASQVDIASLLSDNPHNVNVSQGSVSNMLRRRLGGRS